MTDERPLWESPSDGLLLVASCLWWPLGLRAENDRLNDVYRLGQLCDSTLVKLGRAALLH